MKYNFHFSRLHIIRLNFDTRKMLRPLFTIYLFCSFYHQLSSQVFTEIDIEGGQGVYNGESEWIDFDGDNDLDIIISGQSGTNELYTIIYRNNGGEQFEQFTTLQSHSETGLEIINSNNDEYPDILLLGRAIGGSNQSIYINGITNLTPLDFITGFEGTSSYSSVVAGDWNNDMKGDFLISGIEEYSGGQPILGTKLYTKTRANNYTASTPIDNGFYLSNAKFFDLENDGDLDLIISGNAGVFPYQRTELYINENSAFNLSSNNLVPLQNSSIDVGDFNNDGYLDVVITGLNENLEDTTLLYKNVNGELISIRIDELNNRKSGSMNWGDYDNDGDLDILFNGDFGIMINQGNDQFTSLVEVNFQNLSFGSARWGDYDNDGDLDILATGTNDLGEPKLKIYRNETEKSNTPPSKPTNLIATSNLEKNGVEFSWSGSTDNETPDIALNYNLHVIDAESNVILSSFADIDNGSLNKIGIGNMGSNTQWEFQELNKGEYKAIVQSIDGGFLPSEFSEAVVFFIGLPDAPTDVEAEYFTGGVQIKWDDNANNEEFFIIERKREIDNSFIKIDSVASNSTVFIDEDVLESTVVYRVYSSNPLGSSDYSQEVQVNILSSQDNLGAKVFPTVFNDHIIIEIPNVSIVEKQISIFDQSGQKIPFKINTRKNGSVELNILVNEPKLIFLNLNINGIKSTYKLMKE